MTVASSIEGGADLLLQQFTLVSVEGERFEIALYELMTWS